MKDIGIVSKFTFMEMIRRKSFIVSTIIIMLLIIIGFNVPNIINMVSKESNISESSKILISDQENVFEGKLDALDTKELGYSLKIKDSSFAQIKKEILKKGNRKFKDCRWYYY